MTGLVTDIFLGASTTTQTFKRDIKVVIAYLNVPLSSRSVTEDENIDVNYFEDDCDCISQLLSITDKLLYLIISASSGDFVVPLIHSHNAIEKIYIYQESKCAESLDWMQEYSKIVRNKTSPNEIIEHIKNDIALITQRPFRWSRSKKLLAELCLQSTQVSTRMLSGVSVQDDSDTWCIVILYFNSHRAFHLSHPNITINTFDNKDACINFIQNNNFKAVFLIISMDLLNDIQRIIELDVVQAIYIITNLNLNEHIQMISSYSKISGIFFLNEDLLEQLITDICFYRQMRLYKPAMSIFKFEPNILKKLTNYQINFLFFQLFSVILPQLPIQSISRFTHSMTNDKELFSYLIDVNITVNNLFKQFNISALQESVLKLNEINQHIMSSVQTLDPSPAIFYRAQLMSQNDLDVIKNNSNALLAIHTFISASRSFESVAKICRQAVDSQLTVVLFELKVANTTSLVDLNSELVVFSLGTLFRLVSTESTPIGIWRAQLESASGSMERLKDQLRIEIGGQLTWLTFGNYLTAVKRVDAAKNYYKYLLQTLPCNHPSLASINNNIGLMYSEMNDNQLALNSFKKVLEFNIKNLPMETEEKHLTVTDLSSPQSSTFDTTTVLNKIAEMYYRQKEYTNSLKYYREALQLAEDANLRQFFQAKIEALLSSNTNSHT
ncbi:unnamed protein product [Rotaria sp. Silwood2]|nr:unnamed protein product [Rotaria sp. Silwood2]CAF4368028.1 unnamed protein product [Rotaria sp. Silwood2]